MANLFTFWDNGTWEASPTDTSNQDYMHSSGVTLTLSSDVAFAGTKSGKIVWPASMIFKPSFLVDGFQDRINGSFNKNVVSLVNGQRYVATCKIYVPSSNPIASDTTPICFSPRSIRSGASSDVIISKTVLQCKDNWQEISWEFTYDGDIAFSFTYIIAAIAGSTLNVLGVTPSGSMNVGGVMYIDNISLDEVVTCTLSYSSPPFDKTDETAVGANDGTITVHASTASGPLQYRLGAGAWQLSNNFVGLAPGTYYIDIKDTTTCTLATVPVTILAYSAPPPPIGGPITVDENPVVNYNFVPWFQVTSGSVSFDSVNCINHHWDLPRPYEEIRRKEIHAFVVAQDEEFVFYMNFDNPIPAATDFTKLRLGLANNTGMLNINLAPLQQDANDDGSYNLFATAIITSVVPESKNYFLVIYNADTSDVLWISGRLEVMTLENAKTYTARYQYRHSNDIYKYYFSRLTSLLLKIRMRVSTNEQPEVTVSQYRAASSGQLRNVSFESDKFISFETYYYDVHGIRGMYSFQAMETIIINGKNYVLKTPYKTTWSTKGLNVSKGVVEFYEQEFSTQNRYGDPSTIIIIGSDDILLQGDGGQLLKI